jgi:hypothetical protein
MSTTPATLSLTTAIVVPAPTEANALASTGDELASALRVARKTITRMDQRGKLPRAVRIAGRKR